ncbi:MAG: hypothetical protein ACRDRU_27360 [Pseudonocardiaceae bacterium]
MRVRQTSEKTYAGIRADPNLSDVGKRKAMAAAWLKCSTTLAEIRATETDAVAARRSFLEGQLFGIGSGGPMAAADYRDAQDRAEQSAQPKDAFKLLDRTTRTQDETLAKAVAAHAVEQGWCDVLDRYAATRPAVRDALAELRWIDAEMGSSTARIGRDAIYTPNKPPELARYSDSMIRTLATENDDPAATSGIAARAGSAFNTALGR